MFDIVVLGKTCFLYKKLAKRVATDVLKLTGQPDGLEVVISFVSEDEIRNLNNETRGINRVTDVLSYPAIEVKPGEIVDISDESLAVMVNEKGFVHIGDMAICLKQAKRQSKEYHTKLSSEIKKLVIHSMLHIFGYDHIKDEDYAIMKEKEEELDKLIK